MNSRRIIAFLFFMSAVLCASFLQAAEQDMPGKVEEMSISFGRMERSFLVYIPSGELSSPAIMVVLHGSWGTGRKMRELCAYQFDRLAEKEKCLVVYPDGYHKHWNDCRTAPKDDAHIKNIDDVGFISKVIETCAMKWHADPLKVYAIGLSNGGHMCFRLASEAPEKIKGIAVIGACMPAVCMSKCPSPRPGIPVMIVNGTEDPINPFEGGMVRLLYVISKGEVMSSLESARVWLNPHDRESPPKIQPMDDRDPSDETTIVRFSWPESKISLYMVHRGGHTVPGGRQYLPVFLVGRVSRDMDTAEEAWRFFHDHGKVSETPQH